MATKGGRIARRLLREHAFSLPAGGVLALAAGAAAALATVVWGVLLRPLPYPDAGRLVTLCERHETLEGYCNVSPTNLGDLVAGPELESAGIARDWGFQVSLDGQRLRVATGLASGGVFRALRLTPALGRLPTPAEIGEEDGRVVVISNALWRDAFQGDPDALGRTVVLDGVPHTLVAVLPAGAGIPEWDNIQLWRPPLVRLDDEEVRGWRGFGDYARLADGVSLAEARAGLQRRYAAMRDAHAEITPEWRLSVVPLLDQVVGDVRPTLLVLTAAVMLLVLIAGANIVGLQLVRDVRRGRERAVRAALGASRASSAGEELGTAFVLGLTAGVLGMLLAAGLLGGLRRVAPPGLPRLDEVAFAPVTALVALGVGILLPVLGTLFVAVRSVGDQSLGTRLRQGQGGGEAPSRARLRTALVAAELALSLVLLAAAVALTRSFARYRAWDPGFDPRGVVTAFAGVSTADAPTRAEVLPVWRAGEEALAALPGVESVATVSAGPLFGGRETSEVRRAGADGPGTAARWYDASPGYFETLSIPLLRGRDLSESDVAGGPLAVVVNEALARRLWPAGEALGQRLTTDESEDAFTVVGVVADRAPLTPGSPPEPELWWSNRQLTRWGTSFVVRLDPDAPATLRDVQAALDGAHPALDGGAFTPLAARLDRALVRPRFHMLLLGGFAVLAALLSAAGLYGLVAFAVTQRLREMGLRLALGATRPEVVGEVLRWAARPVLVGVVVGVPLALVAGALLERTLPGVGGGPSLALAGATIVLAVVALLAALQPAVRAGKADPLVLLRE